MIKDTHISDNPQLAMRVENLTVHYETSPGPVVAADAVSFDVRRGEILGLVGESGSGKTTVAMAILRLLHHPGRTIGGRVLLDGADLLALNEREHRRYRWKRIALVPQGAMNALNPVLRVWRQIADAIVTHEGRQPRQALRERLVKLLATVGLPERVLDMYPHELSGGMQQRVCIAMAITLHPQILIADEPTSALDVVVQRVVAETLLRIKRELGFSMLLIGHDMGLMAQLTDRIAVMYAGRLVELGPVQAIFAQPRHPYTQRLIESIPSIKKRVGSMFDGATELTGGQPELLELPPGCAFAPRCPHAESRCRGERPELRQCAPDHQAACHLRETPKENRAAD